MAKSSIDAVLNTVKDQGYRYCSLLNSAHQTVVTFNRPSDKKGVQNKIEEIRKRLTALPDGTYYVKCQNSFASNVQGDLYPIIKGEPGMGEAPQSPAFNIHMPPQQRNVADPTKVMSYTEALVLSTDNATMKAKISMLEAEIVRLQAELTSSKTQLSENEAPNWQTWADNTLPTLMPIVDRWMGIKETELKLKANEQRKVNGNGQHQSKKIPQQQQIQIPDPSTPEFEQFLDWMEKLPDEQYHSVMLYLNEQRPDIYEICYNEFEGEDEAGEQEPQEEPDNKSQQN